jgi:SAM-dependent methyltransferase
MSLFDDHSTRYEEDLHQGLKLTGESKDYYMQGRVHRLAALLEQKRQWPKRILDYGCGTGCTVAFLQQVFPPAVVVGTDASPASLEIAKKETPTGVFLDPETCSTSGLFDLCYCNGVFHHIPPVDRDRSLAFIYQSLCPGGWFAFFENNPLNPGTRLVMRSIPFDRDAITLSPWESVWRLRKAGFLVETVQFLFYFPRPLCRLRPLERFLYRVPLGGQYLVLARR